MIKPIETVYKGYRFRSRLEARWAVFFDALGLKWEYEPEGFALQHGMNYLPDFWLPDHGYIEIKPALDAITNYDIQRWQIFRKDVALFVMIGTPGLPRFTGLSNRTMAASIEDGSYALCFGKVVRYGGGDFPEGFVDPRPYIWQERKEDGSVLLWPVYACEISNDQNHQPPGSICLFLPKAETGLWGWINPGMTKIHDSDQLKAAYTAARSARFEHGENGAHA